MLVRSVYSHRCTWAGLDIDGVRAHAKLSEHRCTFLFKFGLDGTVPGVGVAVQDEGHSGQPIGKEMHCLRPVIFVRFSACVYRSKEPPGDVYLQFFSKK